MSIESLLEQLDNWVNFTSDGNKTKAGLTIHYSPTLEKWWVAYGLSKPSPKHRGEGSTPAEALADKIRQDEERSQKAATKA